MVVVFYHLGAPQRATMRIGAELSAGISQAERKRALESSVVKAISDHDRIGQLEAFIMQMSVRIYWMEEILDGAPGERAYEKPIRTDGGKAPAAESWTSRVVVPEWAGGSVWAVSTVSVSAMVLLSFLWWWRSRLKFHFPEAGVETRLGGRHAAGVGAVISFASSQLPPAIQREQTPGASGRK